SMSAPPRAWGTRTWGPTASGWSGCGNSCRSFENRRRHRPLPCGHSGAVSGSANVALDGCCSSPHLRNLPSRRPGGAEAVEFLFEVLELPANRIVQLRADLAELRFCDVVLLA